MNWENEGKEICNFIDDMGKLKSRPQNTNYFFRPGLTWSLRTNGLSFRLLPAGSIFGHKGPAAFVDNTSNTLLTLLAIVNSKVIGALVALQLARTELAQSFEVGLIQRTPIPNLSPSEEASLDTLARIAWTYKHELNTHIETSHAFYKPALLQMDGESLTARRTAWAEHIAMIGKELLDLQAKINTLCFNLYRIDVKTRHHIEQGFGTVNIDDENGIAEDGDDVQAIEVDSVKLVAELISWTIGTILGRWDIRSNITEKPTLEALDPFASLPPCPLGMLQNTIGLPATPVDVPSDYPLRISWPGILADVPGHAEDIEQRIREVLRVIWPDRADAIEQEACEILGVTSLRAYFAGPSRFFDDHLKRYSKSRRAAPIYWPLSTPSGSYTLWLYYHRLTDQTLYSCVNDFVEPKLKQVNETVATLQRRTNRSRLEEQELEQQSELALELAAFRDELLRIARCWQPNLNDGVQITAAPLWRLFQHRAWQKRLKETWEKLEAGDYDWAHLAYSIWPNRVREKCKTDKSLAIAHGLEGLYVEPVKPVKAKKGGGKKQVVVDEDEQGELL